MMSKLYLVATPIGNLEDITLRALRVLKEVSLIAAEDTRETRKLLNHYNIKNSLISYYEKNKTTLIPYLLNMIREKDVALVSEAGMPGISDPGYELVRTALREHVEVVVIPGPSAILAALSVSGLPASSFLFKGFLPRRRGEREALFDQLSQEEATLVFFEAPHRLRDSLSDMIAVWGDRNVALAREMTKLHEEVFRGTVSEALRHFQEPRGEFTVVVQGKPKGEAGITEELLSEVRRLRKSGIVLKEAIREVSMLYGASSRKLYNAYLKWEREAGLA